jgi:O-antigen/teichoic acid export membrane protein
MGLFGPEFVAGSTVLMVLALGQLINVITGSVGFLLSMTGHERDLLKSTVIAAILMLILCAWLIPAYGMMGAAIAQTVSLSVQMFTNSWFVKRALGFMPMNIFARI